MHSGVMIQGSNNQWSYYAKEGFANQSSNRQLQSSAEYLNSKGVQGLKWDNGNIKITGDSRSDIISKLTALEDASNRFGSSNDKSGGNRYEEILDFTISGTEADFMLNYAEGNYNTDYSPASGNHCGDLVRNTLSNSSRFSKLKPTSIVDTPLLMLFRLLDMNPKREAVNDSYK